MARRAPAGSSKIADAPSKSQDMADLYVKVFDAPCVEVGSAQVGGQAVKVWCIGPLEGNELYAYGTENAQTTYLGKPFNYFFYSKASAPLCIDMMLRMAQVEGELHSLPVCFGMEDTFFVPTIDAARTVWHRTDGLMVSRPFHEDALVSREDDESAESLFGMVNLLTEAEVSASILYESAQELENRMADDGFEFIFSGDRPNFGAGQ